MNKSNQKNNTAFDSATDFESYKKKCIWCNKLSQLVNGKRYCHTCARACFKECRRCHRPYNSPRFFKLDETRCDSCFRILQTAREARARKKEEQQQKQEDQTTKTRQSPPTTKKNFFFDQQQQGTDGHHVLICHKKRKPETHHEPTDPLLLRVELELNVKGQLMKKPRLTCTQGQSNFDQEQDNDNLGSSPSIVVDDSDDDIIPRTPPSSDDDE
jgi:hypothetical protein